jgi:hypothetical protein
MQQDLLKVGLSLGVVSSKFLEASNKIVKSIMRRLPGGGKNTDGSVAHLPLVQGLKRCLVASYVARMQLYEGMGIFMFDDADE